MKNILLFLVLVASIISLHATNDTIYRNLSVIQADSLIQANTGNPDFFIIDFRTASECTSTGIIANAIHIDFYNSKRDSLVQALDHSKIYLIYCASGGRSGQMFVKMQQWHFKEVYNMLGGMNAWLSASYPTVTYTSVSEYKSDILSSYVYPNPVSENSVIQIRNPYSTTSQLEIFDISGRKTYTIPVLSGIISLYEYKFRKGEYFYLITSGGIIRSTGKFEVIE
jgi:rhodanese-related sulfurtransferase